MPQLSVFLITDNPLAEKLLNGVSLHQLALGEANSFCNANPGAEIVETTEANLLDAIKESKCQIAVIQDCLRPLVSTAQFQRTFDALAEFDAIRPSMAITETIKNLDNQGRLDQTIDRDQVRLVSGPEVIRVSAIDFAGRASNWSVPLNQGAKTKEVLADPGTIRINNESELKLISAYKELNSTLRK